MIDEIPVSGLCSSCGKDFVTEEKYILCCPECNSASFNIKQGVNLKS